jgi:Raf kinase inhibitor-like YbhB/YbcL family protein
MFCRSTRRSTLWPAAALLALLATAHTLPAQNAPPTVRAEVNNRTAKLVEFALVGPDGKDLGPARSVQPGKPYQTSNRALPRGNAKGYKWVVREPASGRVLKEVPADRAQQSITVGGARPAAIFTPADRGSAQTPEKKGQGAPQSRADAAGSRQSAQNPKAKGQGMTLSGNFNNGRFYRSQLSPGVDIKYLGKPVGQHATPNMTWKDPPKGTKSFALVMEDISVNPARDTSPDPRGKFTHWVVYNIPKDVRQLSGAVLKNATVGIPYEGPNPPKGEKSHTYVFTLYALKTDKLTLAEGVPVTAQAMRTAMRGRTIGQPAEVRITFGY